jgi:hypothetical protein
MSKGKKNAKIGLLFDVHSNFMAISGQRYDSMSTRLKKKGFPSTPFTKEEFRADMLNVLGGENGSAQCRYCHGFFTIEGIAVDHANPLSRGGSIGLENLDYPCRPCNNRKGELTVDEFTKLLAFLETIPLARISILKRLEQSVSLAAGARNNAGIIGDLRKSGVWGQAQAVRRAKKKAKESGLGAF